MSTFLLKQAVDTVFLDWDHTLAYTRTPHNTIGERLARMFRLADLPYTQEEIETALERYHDAVAAGKKPAIVRPQKRREIAQLYGYLLGYLGEEDRSWSTMERLYGTYAQLPTYLFEDARPVLEQLKQQGYKLGVISNHSGSARPVMESLVGDLIPASHIIISEEIGVHKPAKTIFHRAAARLRTIPARCILAGDNLEVDAAGALDPGGFAAGVWLDRKDKGKGQLLPANVVRIASLYELPQILRQCDS